MFQLDELTRYQSHKTVAAKPMSRGEYNERRGWSLPANEDPADPGYLVVYNIGESRQHVSWSPKDVFEEGNRKADTWHDRLVIELIELEERLSSLVTFLDMEDKPCTEQEVAALAGQARMMLHLADALRERSGRPELLPVRPDNIQSFDDRKSTDLRVWLAGGALHITAGTALLAHSITMGRGGLGGVSVVDPDLFASELLGILRREEEDGTTLVHTMLDEAAELAAEDGVEGIEYDD
ncbi:crAss001_48 related protein [Aeromonas sp. Y311-2]|uniref:crAss001_48 related protein n=1 Tax=Aeromonas sp. Y311-2 TaxID=2990507 RepID=UPI0022E396DF|nr:hypothetical protein [Aeromonas sp. Y311-2]